MDKIRNSEEVVNLINARMAEADSLRSKESMTDEDSQKLDGIVNDLEALDKEKTQAVARERLEAVRSKLNEPTRPAPRVPAQVREHSRATPGEGLARWLASTGPDADLSPEASQRARDVGISLGNNFLRLPVNYGTLNRRLREHQRTILTKGGSGSGSDYVWQSYSSKVVEYLTYFSPVLGYLSSETTSDGNLRTYFRVDDTSMESAYLTNGGGSETTPTIPDTNLSTDNVIIGCFDITSGFQKVSFQELRDSYVSLEDKIAKANSNSHARKLEREILNASGNGQTGVQGITAAADAQTPVDAWDQDAVMDLINTVPPQYRANVILMSNDATKQAINKALRDDIGRSLFGTTVDMGMEFDTLLGKKYIVSQFLANDYLLAFVPEFYQLRLVEGQVFQSFTERFWPHSAWAGIMSFGGAWIGPSSACVSLSLSGS